MAGLHQQSGPAPAALAFTILTATRSGEVLGARWDEIDLGSKVWIIPASRTKAHKEHRVPLSDPALAVLAAMAATKMNDYVFPGQRGRLSQHMLTLALQRAGRGDVTVHGFRSAFRDWAGDGGFPREVCEQALGHIVGNQTEQAYRRGDALDKRRSLMDAWAAFCEDRGADIVPIRGAR